MTTPTEQLQTLGIALPTPVAPLGSYVPGKKSGTQIVTSGQLPIDADGQLAAGRLGADLDVEAGQAAARQAVLNALAIAADIAGGIDQITSIFKVVVFVNSTPDFTEQAAVANGASDVLAQIFGDAGRHIRSAVGMVSLPKNAAVEVELTVETA